MTDRPLVSVIVPSYNHARFVQACLESVAADPYPAKELVIIDDGSTDGSAHVIQSWIEQPSASELAIRYEVHPNHGQTRTLNELLALASGRYIAYVASDDLLVPGGLGCGWTS